MRPKRAPKKPNRKTEWTAGDVRKILVNPLYCIDIHPANATPHAPIISEEEWITAATELIRQEGPKSFLRSLLDILKGCETPYGYRETPAAEPPDPPAAG